MNETQIFQVISDLNLGGDLKKAGDFLEIEIDKVADLVDMGVLKVIEGANNVDEAVQKVKEEADAKIQEAEIAAEAAPKNTWEATKPDATADAAAAPVETDTTTANADANAGGAAATTENAPEAPVLTKYTVLKEGGISVANPDDANAPIEYGQGVEVDLNAADPATAALLTDGSIEILAVKAPDEETGADL
jgi:hypothetical protein